MRSLVLFPKYSLRRRVMVLVTGVILAMTSLDLVAAHWSLQRSLTAYTTHNEVDQAGDWAQLMGVLYDEFGSWTRVQQHLASESSLEIDGQTLQQLKAVILLRDGTEIRTQANLQVKSGWKSAPIVFHKQPVATLWMQAYVSPQVNRLKRRITFNFDGAQFLVGFLTAFLAFLFVVVWIRNFLKPLEQLAQSASAMTAGDFNTPLPGGGDVEIQNVVNAFSVTRQRLQEAQETRKKVLADIHHELRTPLNVIANRLEAIHLGLFQWDKETATILHAETERIRTIVDELEQLNEFQTGIQKLSLSWIEAHDWLPQLMALYRVEANLRNVELRLSLPPSPVRIWMDKNRMSQVIINLLSNALRYTPAGKRIEVAVEAEQTGAVLTVKDEGTGIEPAYLPFIFERFYRVEPSRSRDLGGAGLGLAIVQEVVNAHHGEVTVRSLPGEGTCFRIFLPEPN